MYSLAVFSALLLTGTNAATGSGVTHAGDWDANGIDGMRVLSWQLHPVQPVPPVRIWVDQEFDLFHPGDRVDVRFRTSENAYVAVLHVDTEGRLDLAYPSSRWDDEFVLARRTYSIPMSGRSSSFAVSRSPGIGYFYIIASRTPLDLSFFFSPRAGHLDLFGHGRMIRGDPFWALEQLTDLLARDGYGRVATDIYSYHVGGVHRYPTYACYDRFARHDPFSGYPSYASCYDVQRLLVRHPHYYDTRRYRGDRTVYLREIDRLAPLHGFKERPDLPTRGATWREPLVPQTRGMGVTPIAPGRAEREAAVPDPRRETPAAPTRQRPTLERRPEPRAAEPRSAEPRGSGQTPSARPQQEPQARPAPAREEARPQSRGGGVSPTRTAPAREEARPQSRGGGVSPTRTAPARGEATPQPRESRGSAAPASTGTRTSARARPQ